MKAMKANVAICICIAMMTTPFTNGEELVDPATAPDSEDVQPAAAVQNDEELAHDELELDPATAFKQIDTNNDGKVSHEELARSSWPDDMVQNHDKDGDGELSFEEFDEAAKPPEHGGVDLGSLDEENVLARALEGLDVRTEEQFNRIDADGDGKITKGEMVASFVNADEHVVEDLELLFGMDDRDSDGYVSMEEYLSHQTSMEEYLSHPESSSEDDDVNDYAYNTHKEFLSEDDKWMDNWELPAEDL